MHPEDKQARIQVGHAPLGWNIVGNGISWKPELSLNRAGCDKQAGSKRPITSKFIIQPTDPGTGSLGISLVDIKNRT
jgi:hypothetical protein